TTLTTRHATTSRQKVAAASAITAAAICIWPVLAQSASAATQAEVEGIEDIAPSAGWTRVDARATPWRPIVNRPLAARLQTFAREGQRVYVHMAIFGRPTAESKLIGSSNRLIESQATSWRQLEGRLREVRATGGDLDVQSSKLAGPKGRVVVWHWYLINGNL